MIDLQELKRKIHESDRYKGSEVDNILTEFPDSITEREYIVLLPVILRLGSLVNPPMAVT